MKKRAWAYAIASCLTLLSAQAQTTLPSVVDPAIAQRNAALDKIATDYKADKAACNAMKDNAKDVCVEEAKGKEKIAIAELDQMQRPSDRNSRRVAEAKVNAAYHVAREKCNALKGDAKSSCVDQAKATEAKGNADIKAMSK